MIENMRSSTSDGADNLVLSTYDQSLGAGLPALFRMLCFDYMPDLERLVMSLHVALERFPRFSTRIVMTPDGGLSLVPLDEPLLIEARPQIEWTSNGFEVEQISDFVGKLERVSGQPTLSVTLTPVTGGSVLGVSCSHAIGDMYSFYSFLAFWSEQCCKSGLTIESKAAGLRVGIFDTEKKRISSRRVCCKESQFDPSISRMIIYDYTSIKFDRDFLNTLRAELTTKDVIPTINEALMAFLTHRYGTEVMRRTTGLRLRIPVNVRGMHPAIPHNYIGNAILEAIIPLGELIDSPTFALETVRRIRDAIASVKKREYLEDVFLVHNHSVGLMRGKGLAIYDRETDILSTVLTSMHFHKLNFGAGAPVRCFGMSMAYKGFSVGAQANGAEVHIFSDHGTISSIGNL